MLVLNYKDMALYSIYIIINATQCLHPKYTHVGSTAPFDS